MSLLVICLAAGCAGSKGPEILVDGDTYKFGKVKEGQEVVFTFFFTNPGSGDLLIKDLYISCECVHVKKYDRRVKPGARGQVYGVIDTKGLSGETFRAIKLTTNIPGKEEVLLMLEGEVVQP